MGHSGSLYDYIIHVALIVRLRVANYQLPTSSGYEVYIVKLCHLHNYCWDLPEHTRSWHKMK